MQDRPVGPSHSCRPQVDLVVERGPNLLEIEVKAIAQITKEPDYRPK
ncbi:MAG: hypothetical protein PVI57_14235 [Gemmatimonadota bacterium]